MRSVHSVRQDSAGRTVVTLKQVYSGLPKKQRNNYAGRGQGKCEKTKVNKTYSRRNHSHHLIKEP